MSFQIRLMLESDLASANELRRLAEWNQTEEDCRRLLGFAPEGCFVAVEGAQVLGTVTTTTYGPGLAWIGMMLVHPEHRRRGIATALMNRALEHLHAGGVNCVKLDATPAGRPLYERLGFWEEFSLTRWHSNPMGLISAGQERNRNTRPLEPGDWPQIGRIDAAVFGVDRGFLLRKFAEAAVAGQAWPLDGPVLSWGLLRTGAHSDYIGPLEGAPEGVEPILSDLLAHSGTRPVFWDVPDDRRSAIEIARQLGFQPLRPLTRMRLGLGTPARAPEALFGIVDPAVG